MMIHRTVWLLAFIGGCGDVPLPPGADPVCTHEVDTQWNPLAIGVAPDWSHAGPIPPRTDDAAISMRVVLPAQVGLHSVYPVEAGQPAPFRLRYVIGREDTTTDVTVTILVNAGMRPFLYLGEAVTRTTMPVTDGHVEMEIALPPSSMDDGLNRIDVLTFIHRNGGYRLVMGPIFTIAYQSLEEQHFSATEGVRSEPSSSSVGISGYRTLSSSPDSGERYFPRYTGFDDVLEPTTPMTLRIHSWTPRSGCEPLAQNADEVVIVAFRDMEPFPLGEWGRIATVVPRGEQRVARFDLDTSFPDEEFHHLVVVALTGMTRPTRVAGAGLAPWAGTGIVTEIFWGWQPTEH